MALLQRGSHRHVETPSFMHVRDCPKCQQESPKVNKNPQNLHPGPHCPFWTQPSPLVGSSVSARDDSASFGIPPRHQSGRTQSTGDTSDPAPLPVLSENRVLCQWCATSLTGLWLSVSPGGQGQPALQHAPLRSTSVLFAALTETHLFPFLLQEENQKLKLMAPPRLVCIACHPTRAQLQVKDVSHSLSFPCNKDIFSMGKKPYRGKQVLADHLREKWCNTFFPL